MTLKSRLIPGIIALGLLANCAPDPYAYQDPNARAKGGAAVGAALGGLLGATSGGDDRLAKGILGAAAGAAIGGAIGSSVDKQAAELRAQLGNNSTVTNNNGNLTVTMGQDILFATDSATLTQYADIQAVAANLQRYPNSRVDVIGHTDSDGDANYNQNLSERRAMAVKSALGSYGLSPNRVAAYGRGENQPVATNLTAQGKQANRRVEIVIRPTN